MTRQNLRINKKYLTIYLQLYSDLDLKNRKVNNNLKKKFLDTIYV